MIIPYYVYDYVFFGGNIICHVLSVVGVIISNFFFFFSSVLYSAAKATGNRDVIPCHVLFVMFSIKQ